MSQPKQDPLAVLRNLGQGTPGRIVRPMGEPDAEEAAALAPRRGRRGQGDAPPQASPTPGARVVAGYSIEKSEPLPQNIRPTREKMASRAKAMDALEVGEHFTVAGVRTQEAARAAYRYLKANGDIGARKFVSRPVKGGLRIWRSK